MDRHDQEHYDLMLLHALRALPPDELSTVEVRLGSCPECRQEFETLRPILDSFVAWPVDVLRPSSPLWARVATRIAEETGGLPILAPVPQAANLEWEEVAPGISCLMVAVDRERDRVSMLVRLAPGTDYPPHRHSGVEELHLLHGELMINDRKLYPGDYNRAEPDSTDYRVWSQTGCTCVLVTSTEDVIL